MAVEAKVKGWRKGMFLHSEWNIVTYLLMEDFARILVTHEAILSWRSNPCSAWICSMIRFFLISFSLHYQISREVAERARREEPIPTNKRSYRGY